jgi:endonuclease/exonuclease/phosphatase (EEP) superfamily protein YafD
VPGSPWAGPSGVLACSVRRVTLVVWLIVAGLALPALWRVTRHDGHLLAVWSLALTPWLALLAVAVGVGAALLRQPVAALASLVLGAMYAVWTWPERGRGEATRPPPSSGSVSFRVLTVNLRDRNPVPERAAAALAAIDADVLLLQEVTAELAGALRSAGLNPDDGRGVLDPQSRGGDGMAVLARSAFREASATSVGGRPATTAVLEVGGRAVRLLNVHPRAPVSPRSRRQWTEQLAALCDLVADEGLPLVVAGDFNATGFHRELRDVVRAGGLRDAHHAAARGLGFTWAVNSWVIPPVFRPDHVYVSGPLQVGSVEYVNVPGADHRAVIVEVALDGQG